MRLLRGRTSSTWHVAGTEVSPLGCPITVCGYRTSEETLTRVWRDSGVPPVDGHAAHLCIQCQKRMPVEVVL